MNWSTLVWLFAAALTVHNAEEAVWLPAWSQKKGYWRISATIAEARFILLSHRRLLSLRRAGHSRKFNRGSSDLWIRFSDVIERLSSSRDCDRCAARICAGTETAVLLNLPLTCLLLRRAFLDKRILPRTFAWAGPTIVVGSLVLIFLLFLFSRQLRNHGACNDAGSRKS
jgi:hypothetical protein